MQHRDRCPARVRFLILLLDQIGQRDRIQIVEHPHIQIRPQIVRHAALVIVAIFLAPALRRIERLVDRKNDVRHRRLIHRPLKLIATARPARARHQPPPPQLAEQLLQI